MAAGTLPDTPRRGSASLDWPLSREEKKSRVLDLYGRDVGAANQLLREYARQLQSAPLARAPQEQPALGRRRVRAEATGEEQEAPLHLLGSLLLGAPPAAGGSLPGAGGSGNSQASRPRKGVTAEAEENSPGEAVEKLRLAMAGAAAGAAAALGALLGRDGGHGVVGRSEWGDGVSGDVEKPRARSEGANRGKAPLASALRQPRTPRRRYSRGGARLRVSFSKEVDKRPEESSSDESDSSCHEPEPQPSTQEEEAEDEELALPKRSAARRARLRDRLHGYTA